MKPECYRDVHILSQATPYQVDAGYLAGRHSGAGILPVGRIVWVQNSSILQSPGSRVAVYAEGLGIIFLDPHSYDAARQTHLQIDPPGLMEPLC